MCQTMFLKWMQFGIHIYSFLLKYMLGLLLILISKSWGWPPLGPGMPFLDRDTCAGGGGGCYLFLPRFSSLYDAIHGWMTGQTDGWMDESPDEKSFTTSFTICNCWFELLLWWAASFHHRMCKELLVVQEHTFVGAPGQTFALQTSTRLWALSDQGPTQGRA